MSSSCDTARPSRVLRGVQVRRAALVELPAEPSSAGAAADAAAAVAQLEAEQAAGYAAGHAEGMQAAARQAAAERAAAAAEAASLLQALERAVRDLEARTTAELGAVEDAIVTGALALAEGVLGREAEAPGAGRDAVARALGLVPGAVDVTVHLHPQDLAALDPGDVPAGVALVADAAVERGGCLAVVGDCTVDARLGAALERAREALR